MIGQDEELSRQICSIRLNRNLDGQVELPIRKAIGQPHICVVLEAAYAVNPALCVGAAIQAAGSWLLFSGTAAGFPLDRVMTDIFYLSASRCPPR